jgi:hypothetical protein
MYDFKGKSTNISPGRMQTESKKSMDTYSGESMDTYSRKSSVISKDYQKIKFPPKIRFRHLSGTYTSDSQEAASSTSSIIWDGVGIGQTVFKRKMSISGITVELENTSMDFSYTYGDEYTLTLGSSSVSSGELIVITSDSEIYTSSTVFGYGYFSILGIEFGIFEILLGYKYIRYAFTDLESNTTTSLYMSSFDDSGSLYLTGIGLVF